MKSIRVLILFYLAFTSLVLTGQTKQLDSVNFWFNQAEKLSFENPDSALTCVIKAYSQSKQILQTKPIVLLSCRCI